MVTWHTCVESPHVPGPLLTVARVRGTDPGPVAVPSPVRAVIALPVAHVGQEITPVPVVGEGVITIGPVAVIDTAPPDPPELVRAKPLYPTR